MSNNTHDDQAPEITPLYDEVVIQHYPGGYSETIRTVTSGIDPDTGKPTKTTEKYQEADGECVNKFDLHGDKVPAHLSKGGAYVQDADGFEWLFCRQCIEHNKDLIKSKKDWRFFSYRNHETYKVIPR